MKKPFVRTVTGKVTGGGLVITFGESAKNAVDAICKAIEDEEKARQESQNKLT